MVFSINDPQRPASPPPVSSPTTPSAPGSLRGHAVTSTPLETPVPFPTAPVSEVEADYFSSKHLKRHPDPKLGPTVLKIDTVSPLIRPSTWKDIGIFKTLLHALDYLISFGAAEDKTQFERIHAEAKQIKANIIAIQQRDVPDEQAQLSQVRQLINSLTSLVQQCDKLVQWSNPFIERDVLNLKTTLNQQIRHLEKIQSELLSYEEAEEMFAKICPQTEFERLPVLSIDAKGIENKQLQSLDFLKQKAQEGDRFRLEGDGIRKGIAIINVSAEGHYQLDVYYQKTGEAPLHHQQFKHASVQHLDGSQKTIVEEDESTVDPLTDVPLDGHP